MWEERHEEVFLCRGYAKLVAVAVAVGGHETKERKERKKREREREGREGKGKGRPDSGQEASNAAAGMHRRFVSVRRPRQECEA